MSLSNRERTGTILWSVREIIEKTEFLKKCEHPYSLKEKAEKLCEFCCDKLWPSLIGNDRNSSHWITGSPSDGVAGVDNEDLWSVAVQSALPRIRGDGKESPSPEETFGGFQPLDTLSISSLLHNTEQHSLGCVCEIYEMCENIVYALRRYNDEYLTSRKEFSDLIANIQGTCFSILYENTEFSKGYVVSLICKKLYGDHYRIGGDASYVDVVDEWLYTQNSHHDLNRSMNRCEESLDWVISQHLILLKGSSDGELLKKNRVLVALRMMGRRFHYDHQYTDMIKILTKDADLKNDVAFLDEVKTEFENCKKADAEYRAKNNSKAEEECSSEYYHRNG